MKYLVALLMVEARIAESYFDKYKEYAGGEWNISDLEGCKKMWQQKKVDHKYFENHTVEKCWEQDQGRFNYVIMIQNSSHDVKRCFFAYHYNMAAFAGREENRDDHNNYRGLALLDKYKKHKDNCLNLDKKDQIRI